MSVALVRVVFLIAAVYDFVIGLVFLFFGPRLFDIAGVPHPNHWAYIHFPALLLMIFGTMFAVIARDPIGNRNLIVYGILLKICYSGLVGYYVATTGCPTLFQPFAAIDAVMCVLFVAAWRRVAMR